MIKKILTIISLVFLTIISGELTFANQPHTSEVMTRVILDDSFKPANSPGVAVSTNTANVDAVFGNYLLQMLAGSLITIAAPIAIIIIAISGLIYVTSHGNQGMIDKAKNALMYSIIGLIIIIFSWVVVRAVISIIINTNPGGSPQQQSTEQKAPTQSLGGQTS
jgi:hypothetical protein